MSPGRCLWLQIQLMGITSKDSWTRGPEENDPLFQRPKGEQLRLGLRSKGRGMSCQRDSGPEDPVGREGAGQPSRLRAWVQA